MTTTSQSIDEIRSRLNDGGRIEDNDALFLWQQATNDDLKELASIVRSRFHKSKTATYTIMRIINFTNVCIAKCDYCAFYVLPDNPGGYTLTQEQIFAKIDELIEMKGDLLGFNSGFNPSTVLDYFCDLFSAIRQKYGDKIEFYGLTIAEFMYMADRAGLDFDQTAKRLKSSGVYWITGGGAEILTEDFRKRHSAYKYTVREFFEAQEVILKNEMRTTATMVIGFDETIEERIEHLRRTRDFQDKTDGLFSMLAWTYKPWETDLGGQEISSNEYLRHMALCRIYLDNISHLRTSVLTQNENALEALEYGANDFDLPLEDEVTQSAGATIDIDFEKLLNIPKKMGYEISYRRTERASSASSINSAL
ncbi:MAG: radical SAM protein [Candidatus Lindowbacteria bacterium]|nr:radical SAM protein [Candidatus Lindowbacteria bacterium]